MWRGSVLCVGALALLAGLSFAACSSNGADKSVPPSATCTGTPVSATGMDTVDSISENVDTTCASVVGYLSWKNGATGSSCTDPVDCTPVCVPCPNGTHHTFATWCNQGQCAAPADVACMIAGTPGLTACSN